MPDMRPMLHVMQVAFTEGQVAQLPAEVPAD